MRARAGLAEVLAALGRFDEAIGHYEGLLALNPDDNQGNRYLLLEALLDAGRYEAAGALLGRFEDDGSAEWMYCQALLAFRSEGDTPAARAALSEAMRGNPHVARFIIDPDSAPDGDPSFVTFGSPDEAVGASDLLGPAFEEVAGALDWLTREAARVKGPRSRSGGEGVDATDGRARRVGRSGGQR
jgi:tetratricopeptide (TPR) repeat protein